MLELACRFFTASIVLIVAISVGASICKRLKNKIGFLKEKLTIDFVGSGLVCFRLHTSAEQI